jgi:hypothetical protein
LATAEKSVGAIIAPSNAVVAPPTREANSSLVAVADGEPLASPESPNSQAEAALRGSQTLRQATSARALPPEHLAALIASADEAEVIEEFDPDSPTSQNDSVATSAFDDLAPLQERVSNSTDVNREQVAVDLISHFQNAKSDTAKIDLLAMAAELGQSSSSTSLLQLSLSPYETEDVRVQAVFVAADLAPGLLPFFMDDLNETVREEARSQMTLQEMKTGPQLVR